MKLGRVLRRNCYRQLRQKTTQNRRFGIAIGQALGFDSAHALFTIATLHARGLSADRLGQGGGAGQAAKLRLHRFRGQLGSLPAVVRPQAGCDAEYRAIGRRGANVQPCLLRCAGLLRCADDARHGDARAARRFSVSPQIGSSQLAPGREAVVDRPARAGLLCHEQLKDRLQLQGRHEAGVGHVVPQGDLAQSA